MPVAVRILDYRDIRTRDLRERGRVLLQELSDVQLEVEWRRRIAANVQRRLAAEAERAASELHIGAQR